MIAQFYWVLQLYCYADCSGVNRSRVFQLSVVALNVVVPSIDKANKNFIDST
jgi:hypothetical protein